MTGTSRRRDRTQGTFVIIHIIYIIDYARTGSAAFLTEVLSRRHKNRSHTNIPADKVSSRLHCLLSIFSIDGNLSIPGMIYNVASGVQFHPESPEFGLTLIHIYILTTAELTVDSGSHYPQHSAVAFSGKQ